MRRLDDLFVVNLISILLVILVILAPQSLIRIAFGLPFVLFSPGYTLLAALYPRRTDLDAAARLALSAALSLAVIPLVGLTLNFLPWGIRRDPILVSLVAFTAVCSLVAARRRSRLPLTACFRIPVPSGPVRAGRGSWLTVAVAMAVVASVVVAAWRLQSAASRTGEPFTEFYALGPSGRAEGYPERVKAGQPVAVVIGIVNHERRRVTYHVAIRTNDRTLERLGPVTLSDGERWQQPVRFSFIQPAVRPSRVDLLLFKNGAPVVYRQLRLWISVLPP